MMNLWLILVALIAPLLGAMADPLSRTADLRDGTVLFSYPGCEGLTGNAETIRLERGGHDRGVFVHGLYSRNDEFHAGDVLATCVVRRGRVREIDFGVWRPGEERPGADRDLGRLEAEQAVELLFSVVAHCAPDAAEDAVFGAAIAADDLALPHLFELARDRRAHPEVRQEGLFWLAILAGNQALEPLQSVIDDADEDLELREHAVFALTQLEEERAFPLLLQIARLHPDPQVRSSSYPWLARYDRPEVLNLFEEILVGE